MTEKNFMGVDNFVWWFGVVENRLDPLELGRCQVRCFGWHTEFKSQIPTDDLPWAHPILPFGTPIVKPPAEGTMVFGFFADGKEGRFPIMLGTVPGIPEEVPESQNGFSDPYTDEQKAANPFFPKRLKDSLVNINAAGPSITSDVPRRNPTDINIPTISKLARPERIEGQDGSSLGVRTESIANTTIDFQRKNRVIGIKSASGFSWREPFPSFNPNYPFNNVTETESGHALEMDDTQNFERVQLSHRVGSTLEFLPSGSIKQKSFNHKYDITMGNYKEYVNGAKDTTVQSDMFLRVNGKIVIQCDGFDVISTGDVNIKGKNVNITSTEDTNIYSSGLMKVSSINGMDVSSGEGLAIYGGLGISIDSGGLTSLSGSPGPLNPNPALCGVKITGTNFWLNTLLSSMNSVITNFLPPSPINPSSVQGNGIANKIRTGVPTMRRTTPANKQEKTNVMAFTEQKNANVAIGTSQ